jgi:hypothetical protein
MNLSPKLVLNSLICLSLRGRFDRGNLIEKAEIASASPRNDNLLSAILGYYY